MSIETFANSRPRSVFFIFWRLSKEKWQKVLDGKKFPYGRVALEKALVRLTVTKKNVIKTFSWLMEKHKLWGIPLTTKSGESRIFFPFLRILSKQELRKFHLSKTREGCVFTESLKVKQVEPAIPEEELDFVEVNKELSVRLEKFRQKN